MFIQTQYGELINLNSIDKIYRCQNTLFILYRDSDVPEKIGEYKDKISADIAFNDLVTYMSEPVYTVNPF
jgi:hypothetical protein